MAGSGGGGSNSGKKTHLRTKKLNKTRPNNNNNNNNKINNNSSNNNKNELLYMTKNQLKNECRKRGQKTTGNKIELLQRLGVKMATNVGTTAPTPNNRNNNRNNNYKKRNLLLSNGMSSIATATTTNNQGASGDLNEKTRKEKEKKERFSLVLWKRPLITIEYFLKEILTLAHNYGLKILGNKILVSITALILVVSYLLVNIDGPHRFYLSTVYKKILWCLYWIGLGILSSVGLGTGLHTFLLYLGPHIAQVTLAAYECESLNFPSPPYPDEIICPDDNNQRNLMAVSILSIMSKVRLEAMCWGAGTALGELPPYFMARAARLSGLDPDDDDDVDELKEFEELQKKQNDTNQLTLIERGKLFIEELVKKVGFFGILACASIPNPLFDLAGITCGHFLVPFWTFFGATLIGKAVIKMHIQKLFVIIAFNETLINKALELLHHIPIIGNRLQLPFKQFLDGQKQKLHKNSIKDNLNSNNIGNNENILSFIFEKLMFAMILYFILSLINALAQNYHKRINKKKTTTKLAKD